MAVRVRSAKAMWDVSGLVSVVCQPSRAEECLMQGERCESDHHAIIYKSAILGHCFGSPLQPRQAGLDSITTICYITQEMFSKVRERGREEWRKNRG